MIRQTLRIMDLDGIGHLQRQIFREQVESVLVVKQRSYLVTVVTRQPHIFCYICRSDGTKVICTGTDVVDFGLPGNAKQSYFVIKIAINVAIGEGMSRQRRIIARRDDFAAELFRCLNQRDFRMTSVQQ